MPEQVAQSVTELMDFVLDDLRQNERITGLFTSPLRYMVQGIKGLDEKIDNLDSRLGLVQDDVNVIKAWTERIGVYIEKDERKVKK